MPLSVEADVKNVVGPAVAIAKAWEFSDDGRWVGGSAAVCVQSSIPTNYRHPHNTVSVRIGQGLDTAYCCADRRGRVTYKLSNDKKSKSCAWTKRCRPQRSPLARQRASACVHWRVRGRVLRCDTRAHNTHIACDLHIMHCSASRVGMLLASRGAACWMVANARARARVRTMCTTRTLRSCCMVAEIRRAYLVTWRL